jgi:2,3-bisphosphoglycerate-independent phosphoglycerate mutase
MRPIVLMILDGWGHSTQKLGNAILSAETPNINFIKNNYPSLLLQASGPSVGLSWGESGNSEVGHLTIGAGRTILQYSTRISRAIESGDFFENAALLGAADHVAKSNSSLHLLGLLGSGTVHSNFDHLLALITFAKMRGISKLYLHLFTDGKDSGLKEAPSVIKKLQDHIQVTGLGSIATVIGRQYPMDRDNNWDRIQKSYDLFVNGQGEQTDDIYKKISECYAQDLDDNNMSPIVVDPEGKIKSGDAIVFFNFREDSMRQIARTFVDPSLDKVNRQLPENLYVTFMTQYIEDAALNLNIAFPLPIVNNALAEVLSENGKKQIHLAETEKYAHATYFFNCLRNTPFEGERDIIIESFKNIHEHPEMKAGEIAEKFIAEFKNDIYDFTIMNIANADMLAHAGNLENAIKGVSFADKAIGKIFDAVMERDGILIITADHGNAESLLYKGSGDAETKHNMSPVPFYLVAREYQRGRSEDEIEKNLKNPAGILCDVAPTILELFGIPKPDEMSGTSLIPLLS